jgi:hypothetical protein
MALVQAPAAMITSTNQTPASMAAPAKPPETDVGSVDLCLNSFFFWIDRFV